VFAGSACRYWLSVFPHVRHELRDWRARAGQIHDPVLRHMALITQRVERGNLEGAAAYAVLVPRAYRARVVRAVVAFQATYDYVDTLAEQPSCDPIANGNQLHLALLSALDPGTGHPDYYRYHGRRQDSGYIRQLVDACREALGALPSYAAVVQPAMRAAGSIVAYQSLNHERSECPRALARWGASVVPPGSGLRWWEAAAGGASSMTVFALIAAAARPELSAAETTATHDAYFPWISALHVLLDSLIDHAQDHAHGNHNLIDNYSSPAEAAHRMEWIAARALHAAESLPDGARHALILAAMTSFYLSAPTASAPGAALAAGRVRGRMGALAQPTMLVLRGRRAAERLRAGERDGRGSIRVAAAPGSASAPDRRSPLRV